MYKRFIFLWLPFAFMMLSACRNYYHPKYYTILLSQEIVPCRGWMGMMEKCMQVKDLSNKDQKKSEWEFLYNPIKGFIPEKGYIYQLYVKDTDRGRQIPTDSVGQYWTLVKIIHRQKMDVK
ncbi:DUF4377 domain-containing protein [Commensalibacter communis]|uniref:DUF4377 domain-containing protein n=1 Tax=Commensalibacter communis TaxID=2972786 RepID=A0A9W4TM71_9PROT|nr:DUF4377 domain-containing protein [Commensalibacter communis]CAI3922558.1 unnamed protein product [Commensalibacter communis]CAI3923881.1 unnamed protein product [Commensalibacter communis]CAI3923911.1 unnamed protein product [Commensalibacter communis]CAI3930803.1 unnamed protein product [Commensalibacter communis]CAI3938539.1 unnamed protein product [Commensalibacter communis]